MRLCYRIQAADKKAEGRGETGEKRDQDIPENAG
jgi:hypothetical protein